jgi:hypothetical protein
MLFISSRILFRIIIPTILNYRVVKLITHLHLVEGIRMMGLYLQSTIYLHSWCLII